MMHRFILWVALAAGLVPTGAAATAGPAALPAGVRRVLFLGDSITHGGAYVGAIETYFLTRRPGQVFEVNTRPSLGHPGASSGASGPSDRFAARARGIAEQNGASSGEWARLRFINAGLSSETVSGLSEEGHAGGKFPRPDLHERLGRVLAQIQPDLVFACYGMNDGIYLPLAGERFAKFRDGMTRLHDAVTRTGARIIHLTPPIFDERSGKAPGYAAVLDRYAEWLVAQRNAGWTVIDLHTPMQAALDEGRRRHPAFAFARDGVHPDAAGHWVMARAILAGLGATDVTALPDAAAMVATHPHGAEILQLVTERQNLMKLAWLTATGHRRPGIKPGLPLAEARAQAAELDRRIAGLGRNAAGENVKSP